MERWHRRVAGLVHRMEQAGEEVQARLGAGTGEGDAWIEAYRGFGTAGRVYLKGRVLRGRPIPPAAATDSAWRNLRSTLRRLESDEIAGARVRVHVPGAVRDVPAGPEGFWEAWVEPRPPFAADRLWHDVAVELLDPPPRGGNPLARAHVLVPPPESRLGVISDLDDTVLRTNATDLLRMARTVFLGNARTRVPFPGVAAFYRALQHGAGSTAFNPIFYVSSSPWNFYDLLSEFLTLQGIPHGPLFLRDWGVTETEILPTGHGRHKLAAIRTILEMYPHLPFLLIGDSGQEDPEIYHRVVHDFPERILGVYIRNVVPAPVRVDAIRALAHEVERAGSTLLLVDDTLAAARHAASRGWITAAAVAEVAGAGERDRGPAPPAGTERTNRALSTRPGE